jgi:hypothetical protein
MARVAREGQQDNALSTTYSVQASLQGNPSPGRTNGRHVEAQFDFVSAQGEGTITYECQRTLYLLGAGQINQIQH